MTKAVAKKAEAGTSVAVHSVISFDQQLLRIAGDPKIPVARLREIAELRQQIRMQDAEEAFNQSMVECQHDMRPVEADANNPQTHSNYATLYALDKKMRPVYSRHGFALSFDTTDCPVEGHMRVLCYVSRGLFTRRYQYDVAVDTKGPKGNDVMTKTHAGGSAFSYGKRYLELAIFNVTIGKDDDGNRAGGHDAEPYISQVQVDELIELADDGGADKVAFCRLMKVDGIAHIPVSRFEEAKAQLMRKIRAKKAPKGDNDFPGDK